MKKLNPIKINTPQNIDEMKLDYLYKVKNNYLTKTFIEKEEINDAIILKYLSKFLKVIEQNEECLNCKSIKECSKKSKGLQVSLSVEDNQIDLNFSPCSKYKEFYQFNYSYLYRSFLEEYLLVESKDIARDSDFIYRKPLLIQLNKIYSEKLCKGIYLYGDHGTGKTFIMSLFSKKYSKPDVKENIAFMDSSTELKDLLDLYFRDKNDFNNALDKIIKCDLLVLDNFGDEYKNELIRDIILFPILNERYRNKKLTCFISNYNLQDIKMMYSLKEYNSPKARQLCELIEKLAKPIELKGLAYRK